MDQTWYKYGVSNNNNTEKWLRHRFAHKRYRYFTTSVVRPHLDFSSSSLLTHDIQLNSSLYSRDFLQSAKTYIREPTSDCLTIDQLFNELVISTCPRPCGFISYSQTEIDLHRTECKTSQFYCYSCRRSLHNQKRWRNHSCNKPTKDLVCSSYMTHIKRKRCSRRFVSQESLEAHIRDFRKFA